MFTFGEPKEKQCDRRNQTRRGGNGKTRESVLMIGSVMPGSRGIKTSQAQRAASEINECDNPARAREFLQHDAVNHQRGSEPERNNIRE